MIKFAQKTALKKKFMIISPGNLCTQPYIHNSNQSLRRRRRIERSGLPRKIISSEIISFSHTHTFSEEKLDKSI